MGPNFLLFQLLLLTTLLHLTSAFHNTRKKRGTGSAFSEGKNGMPGKEYSDYTDYNSKVHSSSRSEVWDSSQAEQKDSVRPSLRSSQSNPPKKGISKLNLIRNWPDPNKNLGQLSAVDVAADGSVIVFHRGDRIWGSQTFTFDNVYAEKELGAIQQNTIVVFDAESGLVLTEWGSNMFYLPHGLFVDFENNIWVTDVALHQVFKFSANRDDKNKASLVLGVPFTPGNDDLHFCKPTAVAVMTNGDFFVSDGYCNSRIIKFDSAGKKLMEWGRSTLNPGARLGDKPPPDHFLVPHALAIAEEKEMLFVADRENGRIQCFNTSSGIYIKQLHSSIMGPRIFSVAYAPVHGGLLYIVNGPVFGDSSVKVEGFVVNLSTGEFVAHFNSDGNGFQNPHDVAVTKDGSQIYTVELNPFKVWKFVPGNIKFSNFNASKIGNTSTIGNFTSASQTLSNERINPLNAVAGPSAKIPPARSSSSIAAMVAAIASVLIVVIIAVTVIILRIRRGLSEKYAELDSYYD